MDFKKSFGLDKKKVDDGIWVDFSDTSRCKIARSGNIAYKKELRKLTKPYTRQLRRGTLSDEISDRIMIEVMAKTILLDWEGFTENDIEVPYSIENAITKLTEYDEFREQVSEVSQDFEVYKQESDEEGAENLENTSDGS